jgi:hypothetical protein
VAARLLLTAENQLSDASQGHPRVPERIASTEAQRLITLRRISGDLASTRFFERTLLADAQVDLAFAGRRDVQIRLAY